MHLTRGFTLIEMLVVISIITALAGVTFIAADSFRAKGRDTQRKSDLQQIVVASRLYAEKYGTYRVAGAGFSPNTNNQGFFSLEGTTNYPKSIARAFHEESLVPALMSDPLVPVGQASGSRGHRQYMYYFFNPGGESAGACVFAQLERPSAADVVTFTNAPLVEASKNSIATLYNMNYAVCTNQ